MKQLTQGQYQNAYALFAQRDTHHIARSCCEGLIPCRIFADDGLAPTAVVAVLERFGIAFAAGDAAHAPALLEMLRGWHPWYEINDPPEDWYPALAAWSKESHATVRYACESDPAGFSKEKLRALACPPQGMAIVPFDEALLTQALAAQWSEDQTGAFLSPADFLRDGFGMALVRDGALLSGCASFCRHADGYEIQVDTHPDARGKGYATMVCAAFILALLEKGMLPYWDAANAKSMRLAQKLGFTFTRAFPAWILVAPAQSVADITQKVVGD